MRTWAIPGLILPLLLTGCWPTVPESEPEAPILLSDAFLNIAHRGGRRLAPENTLAAFENAESIGAHVLEMDLHSSSEGVLVLLHDDTVDRTTDGSGAVHAMSFDALQVLDAGYWFSPDSGQSYPHRGQGVVIPSFEQVLERFAPMPMAIEIKQAEPSIVARLVEMIDEFDAYDWVTVASFHQESIEELRAMDPRIHTALGPSAMLDLWQMSDDEARLWQPPGRFLQAPIQFQGIDYMSAELLGRAHLAGIKTHVWTINNREEMEALAKMGVDGIMTDDPLLLNEVIKDLGLSVP